MTRKERFLATLAREKVDRPASWLGDPTPEAFEKLLSYFGVGSEVELKNRLNDDVYNINVPYDSPAGDHIALALDFAKRGEGGVRDYNERTLTAPGFFEDVHDPTDVDSFDWPDPELYIDREECARRVDNAPNDYALLGMAWSCQFQDACSAFGMETALVNMMMEPEIFVAVIERITQFYLRANEIFYEATKGKLDAVLMGNDFGSQTGLILSPELIRNYVLDSSRRLIDQAHAYGIKVIHHSCGSVYDIIPDIIELGADAIHPIQALARNMEAERLSREFGDQIAFCGGVDAQQLLVNGTPSQVAERVHRLRELFPTGLVVSPSHEAVLPDMPPENIVAIFESVQD